MAFSGANETPAPGVGGGANDTRAKEKAPPEGGQCSRLGYLVALALFAPGTVRFKLIWRASPPGRMVRPYAP